MRMDSVASLSQQPPRSAASPSRTTGELGAASLTILMTVPLARNFGFRSRDFACNLRQTNTILLICVSFEKPSAACGLMLKWRPTDA